MERRWAVVMNSHKDHWGSLSFGGRHRGYIGSSFGRKISVWRYFCSLGNRTPTPSPGPSYWPDPRYSSSQVILKSCLSMIALIVKAAELQSALAGLPKSFSSQLSQYAQYSSLQQVSLTFLPSIQACNRYFEPIYPVFNLGSFFGKACFTRSL